VRRVSIFTGALIVRQRPIAPQGGLVIELVKQNCSQRIQELDSGVGVAMSTTPGHVSPTVAKYRDLPFVGMAATTANYLLG